MGKGKATKDTAPPPALSLKMDATTETSGPREVAPADGESGFMVPCTVTGLGAGLSGGTLGWVMGFGECRGDERVVAAVGAIAEEAGHCLHSLPLPVGCHPACCACLECFPIQPPACAAPCPCRRLLDQKLARWREVEGIFG